MTNRERLNGLSNEDYANEFNTYANCTVKPWVDFEKWLNSSSEEYPIIGEDAVLNGNGYDNVECKVVEHMKKFGADYVRVVVHKKELHDFQSLSVPADQVKIL